MHIWIVSGNVLGNKVSFGFLLFTLKISNRFPTGLDFDMHLSHLGRTFFGPVSKNGHDMFFKHMKRYIICSVFLFPLPHADQTILYGFMQQNWKCNQQTGKLTQWKLFPVLVAKLPTSCYRYPTWQLDVGKTFHLELFFPLFSHWFSHYRWIFPLIFPFFGGFSTQLTSMKIEAPLKRTTYRGETPRFRRPRWLGIWNLWNDSGTRGN